MADDNFDRRMAQLKRRPITQGLDDAYLVDKLNDATQRWHSETRRTVDLGEAVDGVIVKCAVAYINQEGGEGMASISNGGQSFALDMSDIIHEMKKNRVFAGSGL